MPIALRNVHFAYGSGTAWERPVLRGVDLEVPRGTCLGLLGTNGSGKTTMIRHMNGLLLPQKGEVAVGDRLLTPGSGLRGLLSSEVGLVFQFPEKQLFADTVLEDVAAGPRFAGCSEGEARKRAAEALARVGLDGREHGGRAIFTLGWGEKRKVALAGVLALETPRLVLDEPGAGLDPAGREDLLRLVETLVRREGRTVVFVSHHLDDLFRVADTLAVLHEGRIAFLGGLRDFCRQEALEAWGLRWPPLTEVVRAVAARRPGTRTDVRTPGEAAQVLRAVLGAGSGASSGDPLNPPGPGIQ